MAGIQNFEELEVWQKADALVHRVFDMTSSFPKEHLFGLTSQLRRAALSIPTNLAEGCATVHTKELLQFVNVARRSVSETRYLLLFSSRRKLITVQVYEQLAASYNEVQRMLHGLVKSLRHSNARQRQPYASNVLLLCLFTYSSLFTVHWFHWSLAYADPPTNGSITITQDTLSGSGGTAGSGNPMRMVASAGQPMGGILIAGGMTLIAGYPAGGLTWPPGERLIDVQGTIDDPTASIVVNGVAATVAGTNFLAHDILLVEGLNTITATATDPAGHVVTHTITVFLDTQPPPMPTVTEHLAVTALGTNSHLLSGTKVAGTSIWINGMEVVSCNPPTSAACQATTWSATWPGLIEGDNILLIEARDLAGNVSALVSVNIIVDNLPPVLSNLAYVDVNNIPLNPDPTTSLPKTNFTPVTITGQVDDSLTQVVINGVTAARNGHHFEVTVPLATIGPNALALGATSPNIHVTNQTLDVIRGTIPSIVSVQPTSGSKPYTEQPTTIQLTATDAENDPMECQILLDSVVLMNWMGSASFPWTPSLGDLGAHTLELRVRDAFGGYASQQPHVYVLRHPITPP